MSVTQCPPPSRVYKQEGKEILFRIGREGEPPDLELAIIGRRPAATPYLRISIVGGEYLGSLTEEEMRLLATAIHESLSGELFPVVKVPRAAPGKRRRRKRR